MRRTKVTIYTKRWHLALTIFILAAPFIFLLVFSKIANIATGKLFYDVFTSSWRLTLAYIISTLLAWSWGVLFYHGKQATVALPFFDVLQSFPTFAALPLATLVFGETNFTVILFLVFTIIWPIFFSIISSLKLIKKDWEEAVVIAHLDGWNYFKKFLLPVSFPGLVTGSIVGIGEGWEALIATEIIVRIKGGLGEFFASFHTNTVITIFGILGVLLLIFSLNKLIWLPLLEFGHKKMED